MTYDYELMESSNTQLNTKLKDAKDDQLKLQKAWIVQLADVELKEVIGNGTFGEVRKVVGEVLMLQLKRCFQKTWKNLDMTK